MVNNNGDGNDCLEPQMDSLLHSSLQFSILYWLQQIRAWVNWHPTLVQTVERHVWAHVRYILSICMCLSTHTKRNFTNIRFLHGWSVSLFFLIYFLFKKTDFVMRRWAKVSFFFFSHVIYLIVFPDPFSSVNKELECDFLHKLPDKHTPLSPELLHCYSVQYTKDNLLRWLSKQVFHPLINTTRLFSYKNKCQSRYGEWTLMDYSGNVLYKYTTSMNTASSILCVREQVRIAQSKMLNAPKTCNDAKRCVCVCGCGLVFVRVLVQYI